MTDSQTNAVSLPAPTLDDLISRAIASGAVAEIAHAAHMTREGAHQIAAEAVEKAIEDWAYDAGVTRIDIPRLLREVAWQRVLDAGWEARDVADQFDLFANAPTTDGAARHEARGELG